MQKIEKLDELCEHLKKSIEENENILLCLQKSNDLDTSSSALAIIRLIEQNYQNKKIGLLQVTTKESQINNLEEHEIKKDELKKIEKDKTLFISVEITNFEQIDKSIREELNEYKQFIAIDHHNSRYEHWPEEVNGYFFSDETYGSCAELVWEIADKLKWKVDEETANSIFYGIYADSVNFSADAVTPNTFKIIYKLMKKGVKVPELIRNLYAMNQKNAQITAEVLKNIEIDKNLAVVNLTPEIVYEYYPYNFICRENSKRIKQRRIFTFPLTAIQFLVRANTIIYIHYSLMNTFKTDVKFVYVILKKHNPDIEKLLLANGFYKHRSRFYKRIKFNDLLTLIAKNRELLIQ